MNCLTDWLTDGQKTYWLTKYLHSDLMEPLNLVYWQAQQYHIRVQTWSSSTRKGRVTSANASHVRQAESVPRTPPSQCPAGLDTTVPSQMYVIFVVVELVMLAWMLLCHLKCMSVFCVLSCWCWLGYYCAISNVHQFWVFFKVVDVSLNTTMLSQTYFSFCFLSCCCCPGYYCAISNILQVFKLLMLA